MILHPSKEPTAAPGLFPAPTMVQDGPVWLEWGGTGWEGPVYTGLTG